MLASTYISSDSGVGVVSSNVNSGVPIDGIISLKSNTNLFTLGNEKLLQLGSYITVNDYLEYPDIPINEMGIVSSQKRRFSISADETQPHSLYFSPDGSRMYITGTNGDDINEYLLSTPWDITTAIHNHIMAVYRTPDTEDTTEVNPDSIEFTSDGVKMFIGGSSRDEIVEYTLSTPWQLDTATFYKSVTSPLSNPEYMLFSPDGLTLITSQNGLTITECSMTTPYDISTLTIVGTLVTLVDTDGGIHFNDNGSVLFLLSSARVMHEYKTITPFSCIGAIHNNQDVLIDVEEYITDGGFKRKNTKSFFVVETSTDSIIEYDYEFTIGTPTSYIEPSTKYFMFKRIK